MVEYVLRVPKRNNHGYACDLMMGRKRLLLWSECCFSIERLERLGDARELEGKVIVGWIEGKTSGSEYTTDTACDTTPINVCKYVFFAEKG